MAKYEYDDKGYRIEKFGINKPKFQPAQEWSEYKTRENDTTGKTWEHRDYEITRNELDWYLKYRGKSLLKNTKQQSQQEWGSLIDNTKGNFKLSEYIDPDSGNKTFKLYHKTDHGWDLYSSGNEDSGLATLTPDYITDLKSKGKGAISQYSSWFDMTPEKRKEYGREEWMNTPFQIDMRVDKDGKTWSGWEGSRSGKSPLRYTLGSEELYNIPELLKQKYNLVGKDRLRMDPGNGEIYTVSDSGGILKMISQEDMKWFQNPGRLDVDEKFNYKHDNLQDYLHNYNFRYHADSQPIKLDKIEVKEIPIDTPKLDLKKPSNIISPENEIDKPKNITEEIEEKDAFVPQSQKEPEDSDITSTEDIKEVEEEIIKEDEEVLNEPELDRWDKKAEKRRKMFEGDSSSNDEETLNDPIEPSGPTESIDSEPELDRWELKKLKRQKMFQRDGGETLTTEDLLSNLKKVRGSTKYVNKSVNDIIDSLNTGSYSESDLNKELNTFQKTYGDENLSILKSIMELNDNPIARKGIELKKFQEAGEKNPNWFAERLYNSVTPIGYDPNQAMKEVWYGEKQPFMWDGKPQTWDTFGDNLDMSDEQADYIRNSSQDAWGMYLGIPQKNETFKESTSKPTIGDMSNDKYYSFNFDDDIWDHASLYNTFDKNFKEENPNGKIIEDTGAGGFTLNNYTMDKGYDDDIDLPYISYYDRFDFDIPIMGATVPGEKIAGKPFGIYGRMYYDPSTKDEYGRPVRVFENEFENIGVDKNLLKAGIINAESYNGSSVKGDGSKSGLFGEDYSILEKNNYYEGTRDQFINDIKSQSDIFDKRINGDLDETTESLEKSAKDIYYEYRNQIDIPYNQTELAALVNHLGKENTREFLGSVHRDGFSLDEVFPGLYGTDATIKSKTPTEYINDFRSVKDKYKKSKSFDHYIMNTLPPNMANKFLEGYSKEELEQLDYNGELEGKASRRIKRINSEHKKYLDGQPISPAVEYELTKLGMINKGSKTDIKNDVLEKEKKKYTKSRSKPTAKDVYEYIKISSPNLTENQIVGIVANIEHESGFRPGVMGDSGTSGGLFQHHKSRLTNMKNYIGENWDTDWRKQIDFAMTERSMKKYLQNNYRTPTEAVGGFMRIFERPKDQTDENVLDRSQYLNKYDFDGDGKVIGRDDNYSSNWNK